jgi:hypothetical protein
MTGAALKAAVRKQLPQCPGMYVDEIVERLITRAVPAALLPQEITRMAQAVIRHQLTNYDGLRTTHGLSPEEARLIVAPDIVEWLSAWQSRPDKQGSK